MNRVLPIDEMMAMWTIDWIFSEEVWKKGGNEIKFGIFEGYAYRRVKKDWTLAFQNSQQKPIE
jgi:hypothetical protein